MPFSSSVWHLVGFSLILMAAISMIVRLTSRLSDNIFYGINIGLFLYSTLVAFRITSSDVWFSTPNLINLIAFTGLLIFNMEAVNTIINYKS